MRAVWGNTLKRLFFSHVLKVGWGVVWGGVGELGVRAVCGGSSKKTIIFRIVEGGVCEWGGA